MRSSWLIYFLEFYFLVQKKPDFSCSILSARMQYVGKFLQKKDNSWKYLSQLLLTSYFILVCLNEKYWRLLILFLYDLDIIVLAKIMLSLVFVFTWFFIPYLSITNIDIYFHCKFMHTWFLWCFIVDFLFGWLGWHLIFIYLKKACILCIYSPLNFDLSSL